MNALSAILLSLGLLLLCGVITSATHINAIMLMIFGTSIWAAIDSTKIELVKYKSGISYGPIVLFIALLLLWIVGFPWYLIVRNKIKAGLAQLKNVPETIST